MLTFDQLTEWDCSDLYKAGEALLAVANRYKEAHNALIDMKINHFEGRAAEAEQRSRRILADDAGDLQRKLFDAGTKLMRAAQAANAVHEEAQNLKTAINSEEGGPFVIQSHTYAFTIKLEPMTDKPQKVQKKYKIRLNHLKQNADSTIAFIRTVFDDLSNNIKNTAIAPRQDVVGNGTHKAPDPSWTIDDNNDWWTSLSEKEQQSIIDHHPEWIGNLNGIPMAARDQANRKRLAEMKRKTEEQLRNTPSTTEVEDPQTGQKYVIDNPDYGKLKEKFKDIEALEKSMNSDDSKNVGRTLILLDDSQSDHLRAAVGSGDIDRADNVLVFTPGIQSKVSSTLATEDGGRGSGVEHTENIMDESGLSWRKNDPNKGQGTTAGITYLGYDSPSTGIRIAPAEEGGRDLANLYEGIQSTHEGDPHLVTVGYSYGSLVDGYARQLTHAPDDAIVVGSPGLPLYGGGNANHSNYFNMAPGTMYAAEASDDYIAGSHVHGVSPTDPKGSDFVSLETGEADGLKGVTGHNDYFERGSTSAHGMGQILKNETPTHIAGNSPNQPVNKHQWPPK